MAQVQNVSTGTAGVAAASAQKLTAEDTEKRFLTLLVTQMRNQDPLNPLDNAQITTQLAQLSTVSGINELNQTLQALAASFAATQTMQSAAIIGRSVMVAGSRIELSGGQALFGASLTQPVDRLTVSILDPAGKVIHQAEAGPQQAGIVALHWDGMTDAGARAKDGSYSVSITARAGGQSAAVEALAVHRVISVTPGSGGATLNLDGGGSTLFNDVKQII